MDGRFGYAALEKRVREIEASMQSADMDIEAKAEAVREGVDILVRMREFLLSLKREVGELRQL